VDIPFAVESSVICDPAGRLPSIWFSLLHTYWGYVSDPFTDTTARFSDFFEMVMKEKGQAGVRTKSPSYQTARVSGDLRRSERGDA